MAVKCQRCGNENPDHAMYCGTCGNQTREPVQRTEATIENEIHCEGVNLNPDERIMRIIEASLNVTEGPNERPRLVSFLLHGSNEEQWGFGGHIIITDQRLIITRMRLGLKPSSAPFKAFDLEDVLTCSVARVMFSDILEIDVSSDGSRLAISCSNMYSAEPQTLRRMARLEPGAAQAAIDAAITQRRHH